MLSNKVFQAALFISFLLHGFILLQNPNLVSSNINRKEQKIEVSYLTKQEIETKITSKPQPVKKEGFLKIPSRIVADKRIPPPFIDKEEIFQYNKEIANRQAYFVKPVVLKPDTLEIKKRVILPPITPDDNKINNPSYISYYQIVREKIKRSAYQNYTGKEVGEVTVSFIISLDGVLKNLRLVEEKSSASPYLTNIALNSVKDASPFPGFPKDLDYPQLSFNLAITFEVE